MNKKFYIYHLPLILYLILIFILSSIPGDNLPEITFELNDKLIHAGIYFFAFLLSYLSFSNIEKPAFITKNPLAFSLIFTILYSVSDELHQALVPNRSAEVLDFFADVVGSLLGLILVIFYQNYFKPNFLKQKLTGSN
ncbi:MAG: VanZ family protein [Ignavibacteria bacterium]|nr:VanZ family protein [Ignavibacteria bacterium]